MNCPCVLLFLSWSFVGAFREPPLQTISSAAVNRPLAGVGELPLTPLLLQMYSPAPDEDTAQGKLRFTQPVFKEVPPQVFVFKPGAGPYDSVANEFAELIAFMAENRMPGQLAVVFYDDPAKVPAESLRWEAGVITNQPPLHTEPYSQKIVSGRKVAALIVDGLPGQNRERYAAILGFIRQRRYIFKPPAMEILLQPRQENADPKTEILLPVQLKRRGK